MGNPYCERTCTPENWKQLDTVSLQGRKGAYLERDSDKNIHDGSLVTASFRARKISYNSKTSYQYKTTAAVTGQRIITIVFVAVLRDLEVL